MSVPLRKLGRTEGIRRCGWKAQMEDDFSRGGCDGFSFRAANQRVETPHRCSPMPRPLPIPGPTLLTSLKSTKYTSSGIQLILDYVLGIAGPVVSA